LSYSDAATIAEFDIPLVKKPWVPLIQQMRYIYTHVVEQRGLPRPFATNEFVTV